MFTSAPSKVPLRITSLLSHDIRGVGKKKREEKENDMSKM